MKRFKRLAALALSAVMVLGILNPVFAAEGGDASTSGSTGGTGGTTENTPSVADVQAGVEGSITIKEPQANSVYTAYQIFATITNGSNFAYIVEDGSIWEAFVKDSTDAGGAKFVAIDTASGKMTVTYTEWGSNDVLGPPNQGNQSVLSLLDQAGGDDGDTAPVEPFYNNVVTGYMVKWKEYTEGAEADREADAAEFARRAMAYYSAHKDDMADYGLETDMKWRGRSGSVSTGMILDQGQAESRRQLPSMGANGVTIDGLPYGYYLVDSTTGALCSLNTAAPAAEIEDKNAPKKLIKQVWNGGGEPAWNEPLDNSGWTQGIDANVTDHLYFRTVFYPGQGQENLVLKDLVLGRMTVDSNSIQIFDSKGNTLTEGEDYRVFWGTEDDDYRAVSKQSGTDDAERKAKSEKMGLMNQIEHRLYNYWTFGIIFSNGTIRNYTKENTITVCYEATMDSNAYLVQYGDAAGTSLNDKGIVDYVGSHDNTAILGSAGGTTSEFDALVKNGGNLPWYKGTESAEDKLPGILETGKIPQEELEGIHADVLVSSASVNVSGFSVVKTDLKGKLLPGAKFELYYDEACTQAVPLSPITEYKRTEPGTYTVGEGADATEVRLSPERTIYSYTTNSGGSNEIDTTETGTAAIVGLKAGVYYLKEIKAPDGYNILKAPQKIRLLSFWDYLEDNNLTGADSTIRDTEMADEMVNFTQNNVLAQAGQSMLAKSTSTEKLSSKYNINRAGDDAAGLAIGEAMRSRLGGLSQAWINLAPIQVNDTGDINLKHYGWNDEIYVNSARSFFNMVMEDGEAVWYYGHTGGKRIQIGADAGQALEGTEENPLCGGVRIINMTGIELPHTGGIGTTIFYVVGGVLVVGAGVLLVVKKRMKDDNTEE